MCLMSKVVVKGVRWQSVTGERGLRAKAIREQCQRAITRQSAGNKGRNRCQTSRRRTWGMRHMKRRRI